MLQRETKRQRVARELIMQRSGKALPEDTQLLRHRRDPQLNEQAIPSSRQDASVQEDQYSKDATESSEDVSALREVQHSPSEGNQR